MSAETGIWPVLTREADVPSYFGPAALQPTGSIGAIGLAPSDPKAAVGLNAAVHVGAGSMLAAGILPRLAAVALATSLVPTTLAAHRFWELEDPALRSRQRVEFLKNCAILGGLLVVALD